MPNDKFRRHGSARRLASLKRKELSENQRGPLQPIDITQIVEREIPPRHEPKRGGNRITLPNVSILGPQKPIRCRRKKHVFF